MSAVDRASVVVFHLGLYKCDLWSIETQEVYDGVMTRRETTALVTLVDPSNELLNRLSRACIKHDTVAWRGRLWKMLGKYPYRGGSAWKVDITLAAEEAAAEQIK